MTRIALVDDDESIRGTVSLLLRADGFEVACYSDAGQALDAFASNPPDLAVLDITMPEMDGIELLTRIRADSDLPVVFLSSRDDEIDELLGLRMGADDYILKPFSPRLLLARIRAVLRRRDGDAGAHELNAPAPISRGALSIDPSRHEVRWGGTPVKLTVTEFLLLQALADRPGLVKTRDQLMELAYGSDVYVEDRTVDSHIKRLRRKLRGADPAFDAIETLYGIGYRYRDLSAPQAQAG